MNIIIDFKNKIFSAIRTKYEIPSELMEKISFVLQSDQTADFGDFSSNAAMIVASKVERKAVEVAQEIQSFLSSEFDYAIAEIRVAGPGFINFYMRKEFWLKVLAELFSKKKDFFKPATNERRKRYLLEYVSANPTGPLHLGHGRGGIIGDILARVLKFLGHDVVREFYINDAGRQILKLGESLRARCLEVLGEDVVFPEDGYKGEYLLDLAREILVEYGDNIKDKEISFFAEIAKKKLLDQIKNDLMDYGILFDNWFSEKALFDHGEVEKILDDLKSRKLVYEKDGALWFKASEFGDDKDRVIKKQDGSFTYIASDIAYHKNKFERGFDILVDVLGQDHHGYINRLKATMTALGYNAENLKIILYQLVSLTENGKPVRMSKRQGKFTTLRDVVDLVGKDVARFFYLNRKAEAHLDFDLTVALKKTEENPYYYIEYAYVRTNSLFEKAKEIKDLAVFVEELTTIHKPDSFLSLFLDGLSDTEFKIIKKIITLQDILRAIEYGFSTHLLAHYSYDLANSFHAYYTTNRIIDELNLERSKRRLFLVYLFRQTVQLCLDLLGLERLEKM